MNCINCNAEWTPPRGASISLCPFCKKPLFEITKSGKEVETHEILLKIVQQYDKNILGEIRLKALLSDIMPNSEKKHQRVINQALVEKIGLKLLEFEYEEHSVRMIKITTLKDSFKKNNGLDSTADYIVDSFLYALGWIETIDKEQYKKDEVDKLSIFTQQINFAFIDGVLSNEEAKALFTKAQQFGFSDDELADAINAKIKSLKLKPYPATRKSLKNQKEIICSSDWYSETDSKFKQYDEASSSAVQMQKPAKKIAIQKNAIVNSQISPELQKIINSMVEGFVLKDESFDKQKKWLKNYCKSENVNYSEIENKIEDFFELLTDFKKEQSTVLKQALFKRAKQGFVSVEFLEDIIFKAENAKVQEFKRKEEEKRKKEETERDERKRLEHKRKAEERRSKVIMWLFKKDPVTGKTDGDAPIYWVIIILFILGVFLYSKFN